MGLYLCFPSIHSWLAQEQLYLKKTMPGIIFCIFFLSSPLHCTVVSFEKGAGFW
jgi:ABC-type polysaccharide transport system permease subunit